MSDATARYEALADAFYDVAGMLAPGKDESPELYQGHEHEALRQRLWRVFLAGVRYGKFDAPRDAAKGEG